MAREFRNLETLHPGVTLIEASAGTGKTYTITALVMRLVAEEGLSIDRILVVTFTEAATAELQDRVRSRLRDALQALDRLPERPTDVVLAQLLVSRNVLAAGPADAELPPPPPGAPTGREFVALARRRLALAVTSFDQANISTIHGFCQRTLRENAFESGIVFETELVGDPTDMISEAVADFWVNRQHAGDRAFLRYVEKIDVTPESLVPLARTALGDPSMPVLPEATADNAPDNTDFERWAALYDEARAMWESERGHIRQILSQAVQAKRLSGNAYRADYMEARFLEVGAYFAGDAFQMAKLPDKLHFFGRETLKDKTNRGEVTPTHPFFELVDALQAAWADIEASLRARLVALRRDLVAFVRDEIPRRKRAAQVQSFDDLLNQLDTALDGPGGGELAAAVRASYDVALIDEFQDTDPVQYRIFSRIFARGAEARGGRLFLIGDPKQAIYAFRGADIFAYIQAAASAATKRTLPTNHRSAPRLVDAINQLFGRCPNPFGLKEIEFHPVATPPEARARFRLKGNELKPLGIYFRQRTIPGAVDRRGREMRFPSPAECTAAAIVKMLHWQPTFEWEEDDPEAEGGRAPRSRPVEPGDIAVLVRANWQGHEVQRALQSRGVPCVIQDGTSVFASQEAADLQHLLQALVEPNRMAVLRAALVTDVLGLTGDDLLRLDASPDEWDQVVDLFREWRDLWTRRGFVHAFRAILSQRLRLRDPERPESPPAHLLRLADGERRMTNLLHLAELLHDAEARERMSPAGLVRWLAARRVDQGDSDAAQLRMESDAAAVKITTIHKSKGLEFPIVFCPYLSSEVRVGQYELDRLRFHDEHDDRRLKLSLDPDDAMIRTAEEENFGDAMRLLYVALTRAKERCVVVWDTQPRGYERSALAWLLFAREGDTRESVAKRLQEMREEGQYNALNALANASEEAIMFHMLHPDVDVSLDRSGDDDVKLEVRRTAKRIERAWRITSYSGLVAGTKESGPAAEGHDHAEDAISEPLPPGSGEPVTLADVPAGARFGRMIHEVFEHVDFAGARGIEARSEVERALGVHGFDPELLERVHRAVVETVETPLDRSGLRLADVPRGARLDELGFLFPVRPRSRVTRDRIAAAFEAHGGARLSAVAAQVAQLEFEPFEGFLKGFIDLSFVHQDRWYVLDYKSNDLGPTFDAYASGRLDRAMLHGSYHLQYHLYVLALQRYLRWRVPGWTYERNFGGVFYLFLRGMRPDQGCDFGVFRDRPDEALVRALDSVLDEGAR